MRGTKQKAKRLNSHYVINSRNPSQPTLLLLPPSPPRWYLPMRNRKGEDFITLLFVTTGRGSLYFICPSVSNIPPAQLFVVTSAVILMFIYYAPQRSTSVLRALVSVPPFRLCSLWFCHSGTRLCRGSSFHS